MAVLCKYTLQSGAVTTLALCLAQKLCSHPGNHGAEQTPEYNIYPYISLLKSIVRLHLTVKLGLKHLGNNLHIMSTTASLPLPVPLSPLQCRVSWLQSILRSKTCLGCIVLSPWNSFNSGTLTPTPASAAGAIANEECGWGTPPPWKPAPGLRKSFWVPVRHWKARGLTGWAPFMAGLLSHGVKSA